MVVKNALGTDGGSVASLYLFGPIDEWGEECGAVSAAEFIAALNGVHASRLELHVNSPGGSAFEAIAMRAALVAHPATVDVYVDGLAASAASVLITAGRRVVMAPGSMQMVHRASSLAIGNAEDMLAQAALLEKVDREIAGFYLTRSGRGTVDSWLAAMSKETWFSADEAVDAGLADEVAADPVREQDEVLAPVAAAADHWILASWRYAGRGDAPAPTLATGSTPARVPVQFSLDAGSGSALANLLMRMVRTGELSPGPAAEVDLPPPVDPPEDTPPAPPAAPDPEPGPVAANQGTAGPDLGPGPLDDAALSRIAEQVAERLAPLIAPVASAAQPSGSDSRVQSSDCQVRDIYPDGTRRDHWQMTTGGCMQFDNPVSRDEAQAVLASAPNPRTPEDPAGPSAAARPPAALPTAGPPKPESLPALDPELIRSAIRKAKTR